MSRQSEPTSTRPFHRGLVDQLIMVIGGRLKLQRPITPDMADLRITPGVLSFLW